MLYVVWGCRQHHINLTVTDWPGSNQGLIPMGLVKDTALRLHLGFQKHLQSQQVDRVLLCQATGWVHQPRRTNVASLLSVFPNAQVKPPFPPHPKKISTAGIWDGMDAAERIPRRFPTWEDSPEVREEEAPVQCGFRYKWLSGLSPDL